MEEEQKRLYEEITRLNEKVLELGQRNAEIEAKLASVQARDETHDGEQIIEQEAYLLDAHNPPGKKTISLPNGGVIKLRSQSFCVNGRHIIRDSASMLFCSKCDSIMCTSHASGLDEPLCSICISSMLSGVDNIDLFILHALYSKKPFSELKRRLNVGEKFNESLSKLVGLGYVKRNILFSYGLTIDGEYALKLALQIKDVVIMDRDHSDSQ
jgi:hypothetical protein